MHAAVTPLLLLALSALFVNATPTPLPPYVESSKKCPPKNFATVTAFDINAYVGKWYVQAQQPTRYLPEKRNYCVTANYTILDSKTIKVVNYANDNAVNGQPKGGELRAIIKDPAVPSKLSVGPKFLPDSIKGPYWIVKTGPIFEDTGLYSWAVIVGGSPIYENRENGGCYAASSNPFNFNGNGEGMWIFSRKPMEDPDTLLEILESMHSLGLDTTQMNPVEQDGCLYKTH